MELKQDNWLGNVNTSGSTWPGRSTIPAAHLRMQTPCPRGQRLPGAGVGSSTSGSAARWSRLGCGSTAITNASVNDVLTRRRLHFQAINAALVVLEGRGGQSSVSAPTPTQEGWGAGVGRHAEAQDGQTATGPHVDDGGVSSEEFSVNYPRGRDPKQPRSPTPAEPRWQSLGPPVENGCFF